MALIECRNCGKSISDKAKACIHCGSEILKQEDIELTNLKEELESAKSKNKSLEQDFEIEKEKLRLEKEKLDLEKENIRLEKESLTKESELLKEENASLKEKSSKKEELANENQILNEKIELLEKEKQQLSADLDNEKEKNVKLASKKKEETNNKVVSGVKKTFLFIGNFIRYVIGCFWLVGCIASLNNIVHFLAYLLFGLSFMPFIYKLIWKKFNISNKAKIIIQIVAPIIAFIICGFTL